MNNTSTGGRLLVPIANPETVDRLLDTAIDIAREREIPVTAVYVVEVPPQVPLSEGDQVTPEHVDDLLEYAAQRGTETDVDIDTRLRFARDTATGIVGSVDAYDASALLMGWRGRPRRRDIVLGSFLDRVLGEAPCDVYVKRIKLPRASLESILVPVAGGPHDVLAAELAGTLGSQHGADIVLLHVRPPDGGEHDPAELFDERRAVIPDGLSVEERVVERDHVAGTITDETNAHDLVVLGATQDGFLGRKLVGSVAQGVGRTASCSVIVTRKHVPESG